MRLKTAAAYNRDRFTGKYVIWTCKYGPSSNMDLLKSHHLINKIRRLSHCNAGKFLFTDTTVTIVLFTVTLVIIVGARKFPFS